MQLVDKKEHHEYWSSLITATERRYETTQREYLANFLSLFLLRSYGDGRHFIIRADHGTLKWVLSLADSTERFARLRLRFLEIDFDVIHRAEMKQQASRKFPQLSLTRKYGSLLEGQLPLLVIDHFVNENTLDKSGKRNHHHVMHINNTDVSMDKQTYDEPPIFELIHLQINHFLDQTGTAQTGRANGEFSINSDVQLVQRSIVDGAIQIVVSPLLHQNILLISQYPPIAEH